MKLLPVPTAVNCIVEPAVSATPAKLLYCRSVTAREFTAMVVVYDAPKPATLEKRTPCPASKLWGTVDVVSVRNVCTATVDSAIEAPLERRSEMDSADV